MAAFRQHHAIILALGIVAALPRLAEAQDPRIFNITPANGSTVTTQSLTMRWSGCSNYAITTSSPQTKLNGNIVTTSVAGPAWNCPLANKLAYSANMSLNPGGNLVDMKFCTAAGCAYASYWITYSPPTPAIAVTPDGIAGSAITDGTSGSYGFTVQNTGQLTANVNLSASCGGNLASCSPSPSSVYLTPGASSTVTVSYAGSGAGSGTAYLTGTYAEYPSTSDGGSVSVTVNPKPVASVVVTNNGASTFGIGQGTSATARTYASDGTELTGRSVSWSGSLVSVSPGSGSSAASTSVTGTSAGSGAIYATSEGVTGSTGVTVMTPTYSASYSFAPPSPTTAGTGTTSISFRYELRNNSTWTSTSSTFYLGVTSTDKIYSCSVGVSEVTLSPGQTSSPFYVNCSVSSGTGSGTVTLTAQAHAPTSFSAVNTTTVNVSPFYSVTLTPIAASKTELSRSTGGSISFTLRNDSRQAGTTSITLRTVCTGVVSCSDPANVSVAEGMSTTVTVNYGVSLTGVNGNYEVTAYLGSSSSAASTAIYTTPWHEVIVGRENATQTLPGGAGSGSTRFTITNNSSNTGAAKTFTVSPSCSAPLLPACTSSPTSVTLNDQTSTAANGVTVSYNVSANGTSGSLTLAATSGSTTGSATTSINATTVYAMSISPQNASLPLAGGATSAATGFTVTNSSTNTPTGQTTFTLTPGWSGIASGCTGAPATVAVNQQSSSGLITLTCSIGAVNQTGDVSLQASASGYTTRTGVTSLSIPASYLATVSPAVSSRTEGERTTVDSMNFTVTNASRNTTAGITFGLSRPCTGVVSCGYATPDVTLAQGTSTTVKVKYDVSLSGTSGAVALTATSASPAVSASGSASIYTTPAYAVVVTSESASQTLAASATSGSARFTVFNNSSNTGVARTFAMSTVCTSLLTGCGASPGSIDLADQASATLGATLSFGVSPSGTSGTITMKANSTGVLEGSASTSIYTTPYYSVVVSPTASLPPLQAGATSTTVQFQVYNNSRNTGVTTTFGLSNGGTGITASGCQTPSPSSVTLAQGASYNQVYATCAIGPDGSTGTMTVTPQAAGYQITSNVASLTIPPWFGVSVAPDSALRTLPQRTSRDSLRFTIQDQSRNTTGPTSYAMSRTCQLMSSCPGTMSNVSLAQSASTTLWLSYDVSRTGTSGYVYLTASYSPGGISQTGVSTVYATPSYSAALVPASVSRTINTGSSAAETFRIQNTSWNSAQDMSVEARAEACSNRILNGCTLSATGQTLAQDALSAPITLRYSGAAPGTEAIAVEVAASLPGSSVGTTSGTVSVSVSSAGPLTVVTAGLNARATVDRGDCLTISAGDNAAYECGDLRVVHSLPANVTMNKARAPVLIYNSRHAKPGALVAANVTYTGTGTPTTLEATVNVAGAPPSLRSFNWNTQCGSQICRIVVPIDATELMATGIYEYSLQLRALSGATTLATSNVVTDTMVIVNRANSPFGAGWWLDGFESIVPVNDSTKLWVGGDGSTRLYRRSASNTNVFTVEPAYDRPDTLIRVSPDTLQRLLGNNAYVQFSGAGYHTETVNALGHRTRFEYLASDPTTLERIVLPVRSSTASRSYTFAYQFNAGGPALQSVTTFPHDGVARTVTIADSAQVWITGITDADNKSVRFGYDARGRLVLRRSKLGDSTHFAYDQAGALTQAKLDMFRTNPGAAPIVTTFLAAETRGVNVPQGLAQVYTLLDGPRDVGDTTRFYVTAFGAPDSVFNALNYKTSALRQDARFGALVTTMVDAVGFTRRTWLNSRALADSTADIKPLAPVDTVNNAVTRYTWHGKWNHKASVRTQMGVTTSFGYSDTDPLRLWQNVGPDASRRVQFAYDPATKLLVSVAEPGTPPTTIEYDAVLGNSSKAKSPRLFETRFWRDSVGRDSVVESQIDVAGLLWQKATTLYNRMGRVRETQLFGPQVTDGPQTIGAQTVIVQTTYDDDGNAVKVTRRASPDAAFVGVLADSATYDAAGRKILAIATDLAADSMVYDVAGNLLEHYTRRYDPTDRGRRLFVTMQYDVLNRLRIRHTPEVVYAQRNEGIPYHVPGLNFINTDLVPPGESPPYPRHPNNSNLGLTVPSDDAVFDYDTLGRVVVADNRDGRIRRSYYRNGQLRGDTLSTRTVAEGGPFNQHVYGLEYFYDLDGRRTQLKHPSQLASGAASDRTYFGYDPVIGALNSVTDVQGKQFRYHYTARGDVDSLAMPLGVVDGYGYDGDGNLSRHTTNAGWGRDATFGHDARGKVTLQVNAYGYRDSTTFVYSGLGHLVSDSVSAYGIDIETGNRYRQVTRESFANDALGNLLRTYTMRRSGTTPCNTFLCNSNYTEGPSVDRGQRYAPGTSRYMYGEVYNGQTGSKADTASYDEAGNTVFTTPIAWPTYDDGSFREDRASYYAADGKLYAADYRWVILNTTKTWGTTFEEYRYDAFGRRIWLRSRRFCENNPNFECNLSFVRRTVWDGDAELYEIQMPGWTNTPADTLENDTAPVTLALVISNGDRNKYFGRVAYAYGLGIDRPLSITRFRYADHTSRNGNDIGWWEYPTFSVVPLWNARGKADDGYFVAGDGVAGGGEYCPQQAARCVLIAFAAAYDVLAYHNWNTYPLSFHGSLIDDKRDKSGTWYRRNRNYDPGTGRFTQEDPIGLAGGMNLYGFAAGDPVNFADPFGLCPEGVSADSARGTGTRESTLYCADGSQEVRQGGSRAWRNNNPGNLRSSNLQAGTADGFAVFNTEAEGNEAMWRLLMGARYQGLTLMELVNRYAPASDNNDTEAYMRAISTATGMGRDVRVSGLTETSMASLIRAMRRHEGWTPGRVIIR